MGGLFNVNGKLYQTLEKLADGMIVSILWTIFSLPIFTIGASTTALYQTVNKVMRNSTGKIWGEFWSAFKSNFKQATALWVIFLLICAFLGVDCYFAYILSDMDIALKWITVLLLVLIGFVLMCSLYCFPYISHIDDSLKAVIKNSCIICLTNLGKSLSLLAAFALCVAIVIVLPLSPLFFIILPAAYMYYATGILKKVFQQYWDMEDASSSDR